MKLNKKLTQQQREVARHNLNVLTEYYKKHEKELDDKEREKMLYAIEEQKEILGL